MPIARADNLDGTAHALEEHESRQPFSEDCLIPPREPSLKPGTARVRDRGPRRIALQRAAATWLFGTLRTSLITSFADGVPTKVVSEMLGHASPTITLAIYAHVMPGMAEEAGASLSAALLGSPESKR